MATAPERFAEVFGGQPSILSRAPGRINLIGEHVDYQGGLVMPAAIDRYVNAAAAPNGSDRIRVWSEIGPDAPLEIQLSELAPLEGESAWANYVIGVVAKYAAARMVSGGFDLVITSDLPTGAGLSSSAALESATALVVESLAEKTLPAGERALLCQAAEHDFAGVPCGIMDQLAVNSGVAGHALQIDCRSLEVSPRRLPDDWVMVVVDSGVKHALADGEYAKRKADCERAAELLGVAELRDATTGQVRTLHGTEPTIFRRARHVVGEIARVREFAAAIESGDARRAGELMAASHRSLRDDFEVSCAELDQLVGVATAQKGVVGARMTGGGFGGSTINLVRAAESERFCTAMRESQPEAAEPAFVVRPVAGAAARKP